MAPVLQYRPVPRYPENLRAQDVEGTVVISLIVGADGSVENPIDHALAGNCTWIS